MSIERNEILFKTTAVYITSSNGMTYPVYAKQHKKGESTLLKCQ
jgi:hypothetical protein